MESHEIALWGMADLRGFDTPGDEPGYRLPFAVSWAIPMNPLVMVAIRSGPNREYADEYARVNRRINELAVELATRMREAEFRSLSLAASERSDPVNIRGIFPHKTAATRAGLGWIGRHCQLVTRPFGPWIRLGTIFTDMELDCGPPTEKSF
jgi:epoxyqueuosine reductase QueG